MHGIVSLLDATYYRVIEELWTELRDEFGLQGVYITPYPHFSYHIAQDYHVPALKAFLRDFATQQTCFHIRTSGLALFTGEQPVLYIPIVRNYRLNTFHRALWSELQYYKLSSGHSELYHPDLWMPHITLGFSDINRGNLARIMPYLCTRDFTWDLHVDNLALIYDNGEGQTLAHQADLKGCVDV
jgi:2'-5' RNA ligase